MDCGYISANAICALARSDRSLKSFRRKAHMRRSGKYARVLGSGLVVAVGASLLRGQSQPPAPTVTPPAAAPAAAPPPPPPPAAARGGPPPPPANPAPGPNPVPSAAPASTPPATQPAV